MKLNIEELLIQVPDDLKEAEAFEAFARLIVERCAVECDKYQNLDGASYVIRKLMEDE